MDLYVGNWIKVLMDGYQILPLSSTKIRWKLYLFLKKKKQMCFCIPDVTQINLLFRMASILCNLTNILSLSNARKGINGHYSHVYKLFHMTTYRFIVDLMVFWITIEYFCTNNSSHNFSYGWALRQIVAIIHIYVLLNKKQTHAIWGSQK